MKKIMILMVAMMFLMLITITVQAAEENNYKGELTGLAGCFKASGIAELSYQLSDKFNVTAKYEDNAYNADLTFQPGDWLGITIGERYEVETEETFPTGGINFLTPFGTGNLKIAGYYNYNYQGKDWNEYEVALRIEMYKDQFLYAGVQGDTGDGVIHYDYNENNDPRFFIRGDFNWQWGKYGVNIQPLLYVTGGALYNSNFKYSFNDQTSLVLNATNFDDQYPKYRLGIEYKF